MRSMRAFTSLLLFTTVATVAFATGCSSSSDDTAGAAGASWRTEPAASGTRLRARYVSGGGARELVGFFDTQRNEECTFQRADDGRWRCVPKASSISATTGTFSDAGCTIPVTAVAQGTCSETTQYGFESSFGGSSCIQSPAQVRKLSPASGTARYVGGPGNCNLQGGGFNTTASWVVIGDVVPWTAFVQGVETSTPGDGVTEIALVTSDGARQHLRFHIDSLDADCSYQIMADGVTRCVPEIGGSGEVVYTDSECTTPTYVVDYASSNQCGTEKNLWREPENNTACGGVRAVYSLRDGAGSAGDGGADETSEYTRRVTSSDSHTPTCTSTNAYGYSSGRRRIDANITTSLPTTDRVRSGSGRLVPALVAGPVGGALVAGPVGATLVPGWHDNERDTDCSFALASDGKQRCLPAAAQATVFFTDAACKAPSLVAVLGVGGPCTGVPRFGRVASATCPPTTRVYALGGSPHDLANASSETSPGRCATFARVNNAYDATEVDPSQFVEGAPETE